VLLEVASGIVAAGKSLENCKNCAERDKIAGVHPALLLLFALAKQLSMHAELIAQPHTP